MQRDGVDIVICPAQVAVLNRLVVVRLECPGDGLENGEGRDEQTEGKAKAPAENGTIARVATVIQADS